MRKVVAAINMTLNGTCNHTPGIPDEELHQHYAELLLLPLWLFVRCTRIEYRFGNLSSRQNKVLI